MAELHYCDADDCQRSTPVLDDDAHVYDRGDGYLVRYHPECCPDSLDCPHEWHPGMAPRPGQVSL